MTGSLQVKNGRYYAVFCKGKKRIWKSLGIPAEKGNKRKAEAKLTELKLQYADNPQMLDNVEFTAYIKAWLDKTKNYVDTITWQGYRQNAEQHIIPFYEQQHKAIQDITVTDIESYYEYKATSGRLDGKQGGLSLDSIKRHGVVLNRVFEQAMKEHIVKENPCKYARYPTAIITVKKREPEFYTVKQCNELLDAIEGTPLHDMVRITLYYGLRRSELMGLKWDAIDFDRNTVKIQHTAVRNETVIRKDKTKTEASKRTYPLIDEVKQILIRLQSEQQKYRLIFGDCYENSGYVFTHENGTPYCPQYPSHRLTKEIKRHNLPHITWHGLRHSTASFLIEQGWHIKDVSDWLGHTDIGTTANIYGHISMEHKQQLGESINGLLH